MSNDNADSLPRDQSRLAPRQAVGWCTFTPVTGALFDRFLVHFYSGVDTTSLASIITLMEITGVAARLISESYRVVEVFAVAGLLYLAINFILTRVIAYTEHTLTPYLRQPKGA